MGRKARLKQERKQVKLLNASIEFSDDLAPEIKADGENIFRVSRDLEPLTEALIQKLIS